ncbi:hypothetical protein BGW37DRAFT_513732 [Umbelopsis sp. PMI_123]|nr:hypothetical protein BGW37DRAFT_513732 [Umbelopsis sp. PMI_123]
MDMTSETEPSQPGTGNVDTSSNECNILPSDLLHVLSGITAAAMSLDDAANPLVEWISSLQTAALSLHDWLVTIALKLPNLEEDSRQMIRLAAGIAFLRQKSRQSLIATSSDLALIWSIVHEALTSPLLIRPIFDVSRSAQGFLSVPLCSLIKDGNIDELFRFHVWLPGESRGNPDITIHSHQPFGQSWVLAGEGTNHSYTVIPALDAESATHTKYALFWTGTKEEGAKDEKSDENVGNTSYSTRQQKSTVKNTREYVHATLTETEIHTRDCSYSIPAEAYHRSDISTDNFHATLFFFDAHRGFVKNAAILGPKDADTYSQLRDPAGVTAIALAKKVDALSLCESIKDFPNASYYKNMVADEAMVSLNLTAFPQVE